MQELFDRGPDPHQSEEENMTDKKLHRLVLAALFTALTTVMTMVIQVPSPMPVSYTHLTLPTICSV